MIISGKEIAGKIIADLKKRAVPAKELAAILVGENDASASSLRLKAKIAQELGVTIRLYNRRGELSEGEPNTELKRIVSAEQVGGFILQLPLPEKYSREIILANLPPEKDVDALTGKGGAMSPAVFAVADV